jgi:hypothetical protein
VAGDQFFLYCLDADDLPHFITGFSYNGAWMEAEDIRALEEVPLDKSALPEDLFEFGSVFLSHAENHLYIGNLVGTPLDLLIEFMNPLSYKAFNACSSLKGGDAMVFSVISDEPNQVVFFALMDIPATVGSLYLTDNAYLGEELATNEGTIKVRHNFLIVACCILSISRDLTNILVVVVATSFFRFTRSPWPVQHSQRRYLCWQCLWLRRGITILGTVGRR